MLSENYLWWMGEPTAECLHRDLSELSWSYVDDGLPGYDYPRTDAGWLVAVNRKFAELYQGSEGQA